MRPAQLSPWVHRFARAACLAAALLLLHAAAHAGPRARTVTSARGAAAVRELARPAAPARVQGSPMPITAGAWTQLGPFNQMGRMNGVAQHQLSLPTVDVLSDGFGYWQGYGWADIGWDLHGLTMGTGIEQAARKLVFPSGGGYFERMTAACTDGVLRYTDDDGATWTASAVNLNDDRELLPGTRRLLPSDHWANVVYLLARAYDPNWGDTLQVFAVSFDSGASFDEWRVLYARAADLWVSQDDSGILALAYSEDFWDDTHVEQALENDYLWNPLPTPVPTAYQGAFGGLLLTAQASAGALTEVWTLRGDSLMHSSDAGLTWTGRRGAWTPGGPRGLCASIHTPQVLVWTDSEGQYSYGKLHVSTDAGATSTWVNNEFAWGDPDRPHAHSTNVEVLEWYWSPALTANVRLADGSRQRHEVARSTPVHSRPEGAPSYEERFYVASGGGIYVMLPGDTLVTLLTRGISNQQLQDVATLHSDQPVDTYAASRDNNLLRTYSTPFGCDAYHAVIAGNGTPVSDVATAYGRRPDDWSYYAQFSQSLFLFGGGGPFAGVFGEGYDPDVLHRFVTQDPTQWNVAYSGFDHLQRMTYELATNSITITDVSDPMQSAYGGIAGFGLAPSNTSRWYLAHHGGTLMWSANAGVTWNVSSGTAPPVMDEATLARVKFVVNPYDPLDVWCFGHGIVRSTNGGLTWASADAGLPSGTTLVFDAAYDGTAANGLYLATEAGPYEWNGTSWLGLNEPGMPVVQHRAVEAVPYRGLMRFATWGAGLWDYATGNVLDAPTAAPRALELAPRGNPARGPAALEYALPVAGHVTLELLDVAGRRVATLVDGVRPAGRAVADFDAAGMGAGVYFARLRAAGGTRTAKLVVTR